MTTLQRLTITLTLVNLIVLAFGLAQLRPATAQEIAPVLRAHALEIVDDEGRVRAEIKVLPATDAQDARRHDGISGGRAIAADQFAEQPSREARDDRRRIGAGVGRRKRTHPAAVTGHGPFHQDRTKDGRERTIKP